MLKINEYGDIPILSDMDLLVIGGGLAGLAAAEVYGKAGKSVLVVEQNTFLGYEVGMWGRPWFQYNAQERKRIGHWFHMDMFQEPGLQEGRLLPIHPDAFKRRLEDCMTAAGVEFLYMTQVMECKEMSGQYLVIVGNKSGRQAIRTRRILDTTENGLMAYLLGKGSVTYPDQKLCSSENTRPVVWRTLEFTKVKPGYSQSYSVDKTIGVFNHEVRIITGSYGTEHVYVDIPVPVSLELDNCYENDVVLEYKARKISLEAAEYLIAHVPAFSEAVIGLGSLKVMKQSPENPVHLLHYGETLGHSMLMGAWTHPSCIVLNRSFYERLGHSLPRFKDVSSDRPLVYDRLRYQSTSSFSAAWPNALEQVGLPELPILDHPDVLVGGGGTAGPVAACAAADEGVRSVLLEMNSALGGTGTLGGVRYYWYGRRVGFTADINRRVDAWNDRLRQPRAFYIWGDRDAWRAELKAFALLEMCIEKKVRVFLDCMVVGTFLNEARMAGVLTATPYGPAAVMGKVLVDATGDGDLAAFAGGESVYGSERDWFGMWASMAPYNPPAQYMGNFSSTVNMGDILDLTRFIAAERRRIQRFDGVVHDHATYVAPRESRHILGEKVITLMDQLQMKNYSDTIQLSFSNHDPKGRTMADIIYFGVIPPNLICEIPYGAMVPRKLEQLLIAGRALSCTHDALCAIRMQDDIQQQAGAVGCAAALSLKQGVSPRELDVEVLQERLVRLGALSAHIPGRSRQQIHTDLQPVIDSLSGEEPLEWLEMDVSAEADTLSPIVVLCAAASREAVPLLEKAFEEAIGARRRILSRLLLWHRSVKGLDETISMILSAFDEADGLPKRESSLRFMHFPPDHGLMPELLYWIYSLARAADQRVITIYARVVDCLEQVERDYWDKRAGVFHYVDCVAYGAERLVFPEFIPLLERLLKLHEFQQPVCRAGVQEDIMLERHSYLVLVLARSLARCGCRRGLEILADFLEDNRSLLAFSALDELKAITGIDAPRSREIWQTQIAEIPQTYDPVPWTMEHQ